MDVAQEQGDNFGNNEQVQKISELIQGKAPTTDQDQETEPTNTIDGESQPDQVDETDDSSDASPPGEDQATDQDADPDASPSTDTDTDQPVTLKDLAATLEIKASELYDVQVPLGKGESASLGQLKDDHTKYLKLKAGQDEYEHNKTRADNEMMVARRQLEQLINIGNANGQLTPELLAYVDDMQSETITRERAALRQAIPEWTDNQVRSTDYGSIIDLMGQYGFSKAEVENVMDHRLIKFVHDMTKRNNVINNARRKKAPANTGSHKAPVKQSKQRTLKDKIQRARSGSTQDKVDAVRTLIT